MKEIRRLAIIPARGNSKRIKKKILKIFIKNLLFIIQLTMPKKVNYLLKYMYQVKMKKF